MQQDLRNNTHAYRGWLGEQWQLLSANEGALLKQARPDWPSSLLCVMTSLLRCCDSEVGHPKTSSSTPSVICSEAEASILQSC